MKEIRTFKHEVFGSLRAILTEDGEPLLMGSDVAKHLGYKNPQKALRDHVDEEDKTLNESFTVNGTHPILINESGLYSLVLSSKLPTAKQFKRWVTAEVLPQIRKTGGYIPTKDAEGRELSYEEVLALADQIVGRTLKLVNAPCMGCLTATEVARTWGMDVTSFNNLLKTMGVQYRKGGSWHLTKSLEGLRLAEERHFVYYSLMGERKHREYLVWTPEGVRYLNSQLQRDGRPEVHVQLDVFVES